MTEVVDREGLLKPLRSEHPRRIRRAGIVDQYVDPVDAGDHFTGTPLDAAQVTKIELDEADRVVAADTPNLLLRLARLGEITTGQNRRRTLSCELQCRGLADAAVRAGHQHSFTCQALFAHCLVFFRHRRSV